MTDQPEPLEATSEDLEEKEEQLTMMEEWFFEHYEDPANSCPYDGREGGYQYIYGGPYDAQNELSSEFSGIVPDEVIEELADRLSDICSDWSGVVGPDWYDLDVVKDPISNLYQNLEKLERLVQKKDSLEMDLQKFQRMMIYSFSITSLETYLSDVFINQVFKDESRKQKYLEVEPNFKDKKVSYSQVYGLHLKLDKIIKKEISDTTFHNLGRAKGLFLGVLGIDIGDISDLCRYIKKRHDFVHRGGKDENDNDVDTTVEEIADLIKLVTSFCMAIDKTLNPESYLSDEEIWDMAASKSV